ncbi:MAG: hypothetical protein CMH66_03280 [Nioella sp.]|nr:hypothetical protein [Nioella sp.]
MAHPRDPRHPPALSPCRGADNGGNLAEIALGDQLYRLRITKAGKLILTK